MNSQSVTDWRDNKRLVMRLPVQSVLWSSFLFLLASQSETEATYPDVCQNEFYPGDLKQISSVERHHVEEDAVINNFSCLLYPTNMLNCSWSFNNLQRDAQLFVYISICDSETAVQSLPHPSEERVGSWSLILQEHEMLSVVLQFNITLDDKWTVYNYVYDMDMLELLSPPNNISASIKDGDLLVTWALPYSRGISNHECFEYQLDMGDQERPKDLRKWVSYTEPNADPSQTYRVRIRTRIDNVQCLGNPQWSEWSHAVTVEQPIYTLSTLVIISISLGIPMILLAVLLLVRYQRVSKVLFPPIPRPPSKFISFLEKNETFTFFHPALSAEPVEEITEVEDAEQNPGKTF